MKTIAIVAFIWIAVLPWLIAAWHAFVMYNSKHQ